MRLAIAILSVLVCQWRLTLKIETGFLPKLKLSPKSRKKPGFSAHAKTPETGFLRQYLTTTQNLRKTRFLSLTKGLKKPGFCDNT